MAEDKPIWPPQLDDADKTTIAETGPVDDDATHAAGEATQVVRLSKTAPKAGDPYYGRVPDRLPQPGSHQTPPAEPGGYETPPVLPTSSTTPAAVTRARMEPGQSGSPEAAGQPAAAYPAMSQPSPYAAAGQASPYAAMSQTSAPQLPPPPVSAVPPPKKKKGLGMPAIVAIVLALALAVIAATIGWTLVNTSKQQPGAVVTVYQTAAGSSQPASSEPSSSQSAPAPAPASAPSPTQRSEADALAALQKYRDQDAATISANGQWVAAMSSKWVGVTDPLQTTKTGSHTFEAVDILEEHEALRKATNSGARVALVYGTDYGTQQTHNGATMYVTIAVDNWKSQTEVTAWCSSRFPERTGADLDNVCIAMQLKPKS